MEEKGSCSNHRSLSCLSLLSSSPLFSCIVTVYVLIILYFPPVLLKVVSWPVLLSTAVLLLVLLRIGAKQIAEKQSISTGKMSISEGESLLLMEKLAFTATDGFRSSSSPEELSFSALIQSRSSEKQNVLSGVLINSLLEQYILKQSISSEKKGLSSEEHSFSAEEQSIFSDEQSVCSEEQIICAEEESISSQDDNWVWSKTEKQLQPKPGFNPLFIDSFLEWDVRAPLEVIYEESEEENEEIENRGAMKFHSSLSLYYPESDTETSSSSDGDFPVIGNWDSPHNISFRWDEDEEDEKGLIEIPLHNKGRLLAQEFQRTGEEENMIEIDIFPARLCCVSPVSLSSNSD